MCNFIEYVSVYTMRLFFCRFIRTLMILLGKDAISIQGIYFVCVFVCVWLAGYKKCVKTTSK